MINLRNRVRKSIDTHVELHGILFCLPSRRLRSRLQLHMHMNMLYVKASINAHPVIFSDKP